MSIKLRDVINTSNSFESLIPIAQQLKARLSFWGSQYVVIDTNIRDRSLNYEGGVPLNALITRIYELMSSSNRSSTSISLYTNAEHRHCQILENEIIRFYGEDKDLFSRSNIITKISVLVRSILRCNYYQREWDHDSNCGRQVIRRSNPTTWDVTIHEYVWPSDAPWDVHRF